MNQPVASAKSYAPVFDLTIEGQPLPKQRPRVARGKAYTPRETQAAEDVIRWEAKRLRAKATGPCRVRIDFWRRDARRVDLDNLVKLVLDALNGEAWEDDHLIAELHCTKRIDAARPRTRVRVWPA